MLLLIAMAYSGVYSGIVFGTPTPEQAPPDTVARFLTVLLLDNRAFPMFAILFGYGMSWMIARQRRAGTDEPEMRRLLRRRSLLLLLFGAVHAFLVYQGEILTSYGLAGLVIGWLLFRPDRTLKRTIVLLTILYALTCSIAMLGTAAATAFGEGVAAEPAGYTTLTDWLGRLAALPFLPLVLAVAYPLLLLVVIGFLAGRHGLLDDPAAHRGLLGRIAVGGVAISVLGAVPAALIGIGAVQLAVVPTGLLLSLQVLTGVLGGAGYAAGFALLALRLDRHRGALTRAVAAVGQRSLTFYLLNSVTVAVVLHPDLLGVGAHVDSLGALAVGLGSWLLTLALAAWMDRTGRSGPVDALMRALVYRKA
ncbi:DUF418 domain-containing protein [Allosaccharopolyspora coralli]|uniref:DUF418 domain-containing protein n=2 Tax=Allosaccharopolyspora coralli TaxID=2665642 RepID=A0A5Q3QFD1_9PSEU|nr:DUF418 domain-containing protein [Allosaccharopolyspora coralli]